MFEIGQIFEKKYPPEAAVWCNENDAFIEEVKPSLFEIKAIVIPEATAEERAEAIRSERDQKLNSTQWLVDRHHEETERVMTKSAESTTLTDLEYRELLEYRQALREVPQQETFPEEVVWPEEPSFMRPKEEIPQVIPEVLPEENPEETPVEEPVVTPSEVTAKE